MSTRLLPDAYELRARTSGSERLAISSFYELVVTGNVEAARSSYQSWTRTYPGDKEPQASLWITYTFMGDYERAHAAALEALKINTDSGNNYVNLTYSYQWIDHSIRPKPRRRIRVLTFSTRRGSRWFFTTWTSSRTTPPRWSRRSPARRGSQESRIKYSS